MQGAARLPNRAAPLSALLPEREGDPAGAGAFAGVEGGAGVADGHR